jgi:organic radical activating enzyme
VRKLKLAEVTTERHTPGRAAALFLTDRCPVGCAHCSVDSRRDSPAITDHGLLAELVAGLCADAGLRTVAITGGEPFVERRGLSASVRALYEAGKDPVLFTSGIWARRGGQQPAWIASVLSMASCVFLSSDAYHAAAVDEEQFASAARSIADAGTPLVAQALDRPADVAEAERLLAVALGPKWDQRAELSLISPLPYGRGEGVFQLGRARAAGDLGRCRILASPVVRYDGRISACCNENVISGKGPGRLRAICRSRDDVAAALAAFREDPLLRLLNSPGVPAVISHPAYADMASGTYRNICDFCWRAQERTSVPPGPDAGSLIGVMASLFAAPGADAAVPQEKVAP